jgi:hypothetical protein
MAIFLYKMGVVADISGHHMVQGKSTVTQLYNHYEFKATIPLGLDDKVSERHDWGTFRLYLTNHRRVLDDICRQFCGLPLHLTEYQHFGFAESEWLVGQHLIQHRVQVGKNERLETTTIDSVKEISPITLASILHAFCNAYGHKNYYEAEKAGTVLARTNTVETDAPHPAWMCSK